MLRTEDLHKILLGMYKLQFLDLSCNFIRKLPVPKGDNLSEIFILPSLRFVNLSFNMLEFLHGDSPLISPSLTKLDLSHNSIRIIDLHTLSIVSNLQVLLIEWNFIRNFRYDRFYQQHRELMEVAFYATVFGNKTYAIIAKYFREVGVTVIDGINVSRSLTKSEQTHENEASTEMDKESKLSSQGWEMTDPAIQQQSAAVSTPQKIGLLNFLIFIILLAALILNMILIVKLRRLKL
ncbi:uncharacterized protein LOC128255849 [Drosophila gunungcola]|uniref:uncharacterized protein LOC128255849 n=1 Tax=Drosophila gunungcola TaxID=103775 RepID=UPI0022E6FE20|nr:uncharacterized protein LOC128255849 [Drosophila gunungcola]